MEYTFVQGKMEEANPTCFQGQNCIKSSFLKDRNRIGFKVDKYDKSKPLVIDPTLIWATYFGGSGNDESNCIATDDSGNVYMAGQTTSANGIATRGAFQTSYAGDDAFIAKFNDKGQILWATYYGGNMGDGFNDIATDHFGNVFAGGGARSSALATSGAYQTQIDSKENGAESAILAKFNGSGIRLWATYFGGNFNEIAWGAATDSAGNVYITGLSGSDSGIATKGAYQTSLSNRIDAFLAKFSENGVLKWATYFGGNDGAESLGVATDASGNVFITGNTSSNAGIATNGAFQTSNAGNQDAFLAKFSGIGTIQWATYFGGNNTNSDTYAWAVATDLLNNVYITGGTISTDDIATKGAYQTSLGGATDAFLTKFSSSGARIWATYYGGPGEDEAESIACDNIGDVFILGTTASSTGVATAGAFQSTFNSSTHVFFAKFNSSGNRQWASYYGGILDEGGVWNGICTSANGDIYITACIDTSGLATRDAYQTSYGGGIYDGFLAMFNFMVDNDAGTRGIQNLVLCPGPQKINVFFSNYGINELDSVTIGWSINGKIQAPYLWTGKLTAGGTLLYKTIGPGLFTTGQDTVKVWTSMPNGVVDSMPGNDTSYIVLTINPLPIANVGQSAYAICTGTHIKIGGNAQPSFVYSWSSVPAGFSSTLADPVVNPASNTVYDLTVTDTLSGCTNTNSANVSVSILQAPAANAGTNQSVCSGVPAQIGSTALSGDTYSWTSNPVGFSSTTANPTITPIQTTSYSLTVTNTNGCTNFDSVTITVNPRPNVITGTPLSLCAGLVIHLGAPPMAGYTYSWTSKPPGFFSNLSDPLDSPMVSTTYYLKETIAATGCSDTGSISLQVLPQPPKPIIIVNNTGGFEYRFTLKNPDSAAYYTWNFGDSSISHNAFYYDSIMYHTYAGNGIYRIAVNAIESPCEAYEKDSIVVNQAFSLNIYPNPFNLQTNIQYLLTSPAHVRITMKDEIGRNIGTLVDKQLVQGEYDTYFSGAAWKTRPGMYFIIFQLDDKVIVKKIIQVDSIYY